ncbi:hypothetical protein AAW51_4053 [Caldimonas brevitalea]|uniref:Uncharacterized protein n=1 Tax=Caldimonas brevitalea TaxID=413882 RepID=A0A0G3BMQ1_9BURK|nr:hypothetical protein AAW51_4053 [Caldimonas brevitalea]
MMNMAWRRWMDALAVVAGRLNVKGTAGVASRSGN